MANLNFKEIGRTIRVNVGSDITGTTPELILLPEIGKAKEITSGVTIPGVDAVEGGETFFSGEYIEYVTEEDDLDYVGRWKKRAKIERSTSDIELTDYIKFRVLP